MMKKFLIDDGMLDPFDRDPKLMIDPEAEDPDEDPDAHSCRVHSDAWGICSVCGATVYGSLAYYEETGSDPPEAQR